jgi:hypothetical protein
VSKQQSQLHIHHRGWIIYWCEYEGDDRYTFWIDDEKAEQCFIYDDCLDIDKAIELATRAINAAIGGDFMTKAKLFDPLSNFNNSLARQILRSDTGLDPIIDRANYDY